MIRARPSRCGKIMERASGEATIPAPTCAVPTATGPPAARADMPELCGVAAGAAGSEHRKAGRDPDESDGKMRAGLAAGGHWDPAHTGTHRQHLGPGGGQGHKGDLPVLMVDPDGTATTPVAAPNLAVADLTGHALVVHQGGDNYSDQPQPLGGGGARIACGERNRSERRAGCSANGPLSRRAIAEMWRDLRTRSGSARRLQRLAGTSRVIPVGLNRDEHSLLVDGIMETGESKR